MSAILSVLFFVLYQLYQPLVLNQITKKSDFMSDFMSGKMSGTLKIWNALANDLEEATQGPSSHLNLPNRSDINGIRRSSTCY